MPENDAQIGLFAPDYNADQNNSQAPLAHRLRPKTLEQFAGLGDLLKTHPFLNKTTQLPSLILWGPPGSGKTTLARLLAQSSGLPLYPFNAVLGGIPELKKLIKDAHRSRGERFALFIDEIHRFNKAQQDALLPFVEEGSLLLIGATTENPRSALNRALQSRVQLVQLPTLSEAQLQQILTQALGELQSSLEQTYLDLIVYHAQGDARRALSYLELILALPEQERTLTNAKTMILKNDRAYDRNQNRHYDVISAFIKSLRGSDPDAALLWLAIMLDGGEDPVFIARRLVIFASEDVGNADPQALTIAVSGLQAVQMIGMPEARINLSQVVCYLAATVKSNACYQAVNRALAYVEEERTIEVPESLKNFPAKEARPYLYPHSYPGHYVRQDYRGRELPNFYEPTEQGIEKKIKERLEALKTR